MPNTFPPDLMSSESLISTAALEFTSPSSYNILRLGWRDFERLYNGLQNLRTLHINIKNYPSTSELTVSTIGGIVQMLPELRSRENFLLTLSLDGTDIPWSELEGKIVVPYPQHCLTLISQAKSIRSRMKRVPQVCSVEWMIIVHWFD